MDKKYPLLFGVSFTILLSVLLFTTFYSPITPMIFGYQANTNSSFEDFEDATFIDTFDGINVNASCWRTNAHGADGSAWSWRVNVSKICVVDISNSSMRYSIFNAKYFNKGNNHTVSFLDINNVTLKSKYYNSRINYDVWDSENTDWVSIWYIEQHDSIGTYPHYLKFEVYDDGYDALWIDNVTMSYSLDHQFELWLYPNLDVDRSPNLNITNTKNLDVSTSPFTNTTNSFMFGVYQNYISNTTNTKNLDIDTSPDFTIVNLFLLSASGAGGCQSNNMSITNAYGDTWVFAEEKYYDFKVTYGSANLSITGSTYGIQLTDGLHNMTVQWYPENSTYEILNGTDYIRVPRTNTTTNIEYNSTSLVLSVTYPIFFTNAILDTLTASAQGWCDGIWQTPTGNTFKIYNKGGIIEYKLTDGFGGYSEFVDGGDWFSACASYYGFAQVNQTWRKPQSFEFQYSLKFYENNSGTWVPEDQFMQHGQNNGVGEKYGGVADYHVRWKIWAWDNVTSAYWLLGYIDSYMFDGDEGANDEWTAQKGVIYQHLTEVTNSTWNGFIEEEPAAKVREWVNIWFNRVNSSSIMGFRTSPFYYGMDDSGYILWSSWTPQIDNATETMGFIRLTDGNTAFTVASQFDLIKIEFELEFTGAGGSGEDYRVCIEDIDTQVINLGARTELLYGIDTPSPNKPLVIDMAQGGLFGPMIVAILGMGAQLVTALTGFAMEGWQLILSQFPGLSSFLDNTYSLLTSSLSIATSLIGSIVGLLGWISGFVQFFGVPINAISSTVSSLTEAVNYVIPASSRVGVLTLVILMQMWVLMDALITGNSSYVWGFCRTVWRMAATIIEYGIRMSEMVIRIINTVNPF